MRIVKAVQTCWACPSQWDAWTDDGLHLFLHYRHGFGTVTTEHGTRIAEFEYGDWGFIELPEFAEKAHLVLDPFIEVTEELL
jgi:hypothetical protein